jgi:hypothetical protein
MKRVQRSGDGRRKKGDLHSPKGEAKKHSANRDPKRSRPLDPGDRLQSAERQPKSLGSEELDKSRDWLISELVARGVIKPVVYRGRKGHGVEVRDGRKLLGGIDNGDLVARNVQAVDDLFRLPGCVTVEIDPKDAKTYEWMLFGITRAVVKGQRAVVLSLLRRENGKVLPETHAYRVQTAAVREWIDGAQDEQLHGIQVATNGILNTASKAAAEKFKTWDKTAQSEQSPPWYTSLSLSIGVGCYDLEMRGRELWVILRLTSGKGTKPMTVRAYARSGSGWADLRRVFSGEFERRAARLIWHDSRRRWLLKMSVKKPRPEPQHGTGAMVVCPGVDSIVRVYGSDAWPAPTDDTANLISFKRSINARLSERGQHKDFQGYGARGHGRRRFTKLLRGLRDRESDFIKTHIQKGAARVVKLARGLRLGKHGWDERCGSVGEVVVSDFGSFCPTHADKHIERILRQYPTCTQRDAICWALRKAGIAHRIVKISNLCPACGEAKLVQYSGRDWCCPNPKCQLKAPRDLWTAWQTFVAGGASPHYNMEDVGSAFRRAAEFAETIRGKAIDNGTEETDQATE